MNIIFVIAQEINRLSRKVQSNDRTYYNGRIIEYLSDMFQYDNKTNSIKRLIDWVDSAEKEVYTKMFETYLK